MSFCRLNEHYFVFGTTTLENLFISEFMLKAPGDYVKVYIYGLMISLNGQSDETIDGFSSALQMETQKVRKAFSYWCARGLISQDGDRYVYKDVRGVMLEGTALSQQALFESELARKINDALGEIKLSAHQYELLYELFECADQDEQVVLLFLQYCLDHYKQKSKKALYEKKMETMLLEWKKKEIFTLQKALAHISGAKLVSSDVNKVLRHLGILSRFATTDDVELYEKWMQWGFSLEAVLQACQKMTSVQNPNLAYLDKILKSLHEQGLHKTNAIANANQDKSDLDERVRKCSYKLGILGPVTQEQRNFFLKWSGSYGLADEVILMLCQDVSLNGASYKSADSFVNAMVMGGKTTPDAILTYRGHEEIARQVLRALGINRHPSGKEIDQIGYWLESVSQELILHAAHLSKDAPKPSAYMGGILQNWKTAGIETMAQVNGAQATFTQKHTPPASAKGKGQRDYTERTYDEDFYDKLFTPT